MHSMDLRTSIIIEILFTIEKTIKQIRKIRAKNQILNVLNIGNRPLLYLVYNVSLNYNVLV